MKASKNKYAEVYIQNDITGDINFLNQLEIPPIDYAYKHVFCGSIYVCFLAILF